MQGGTAVDRARFRRIAWFMIGLLVVMEILIALSAIYVGLTWIVIALLAGMPITAAYLAYLMRKFAKPSY